MERRHPDTETLAAFAAGAVPRREQAPLAEHLAECDECREAVLVAAETLGDERVQPPVLRFRFGRVLAIAAIVAAMAVTALLLLPRRDPLARLVALAPEDVRAVQPRITGGFAWARYRGPMRANDARDPRMLKLAGVAGDLTERAERDGTPETRHAAGVAMLVIAEPSAAVDHLRQVTAKTPGDARAWSDLAAAQYAAALQSGRASLYPLALAASDRALELDPDLPEARFNRALILQRLGLAGQAAAAWRHYLALDSTSAWATEARQHLAGLPQQSGESRFLEELPRLERAVASGDMAAVRAFAVKYPLQTRAYGEAEWTGRSIDLARAAGEALATTTGEALLRDAAAAFSRGDAAALASAHARYRQARIAYSKGRLAFAREELVQAARQFADAGSPMQFMARHYAASALYDLNRIDEARTELEALLAALPPQYIAAGAFGRWELGLCLMTAGDWSGARPLLEQSQAGFRRLGERANAAFVETLLADTLAALGHPDPSWAARIRSFETLSAEGRGVRLPVSIGAAARLELRTGRLDAARALLRIEEAVCRETGNDALVADVLAREALLATRDGDARAASFAREAERFASRVQDAELRARVEADAHLAAAAAALPAQPAVARTLLTRAIDAYRARDLVFHLPESHLLRSRAARLLGDDAAASRDLEDGIVALERHRVQVSGWLSGTNALDADAALFDEAMALALDRGDAAAAFAYSERKRNAVLRHAPELASAAELQRRLTGSDTTVLSLVALPAEIVAFRVTSRGMTVTRTPAARDDVAACVAARSTTRLFDLLIRPADPGPSRHLIVVADKRLASVPFAALYDSERAEHLVERFSVAMAESASALQRASPAASPALLAVALPAGDSPALPGSVAEVDALHRLYRASKILGSETSYESFAEAANGADVVHVAGHTEAQPGGDERVLIFGGRRVTWSSVAAHRLRRAPVVVLAACETLRAPADAEVRASSLGGGFLAAGARDVVGTLVPIADDDARELFLEIHRRLAEGRPASEAVRDVQKRAAAARPDGAWSAVAVFTSHIAIDRGGSS